MYFCLLVEVLQKVSQIIPWQVSIAMEFVCFGVLPIPQSNTPIRQLLITITENTKRSSDSMENCEGRGTEQARL